MSIYFFRFITIILFGSALLAAVSCNGVNTPIKTAAAKSAESDLISKPVIAPTPPTTAKCAHSGVLAGGCFWGLEAVFEHVKARSGVASGYSGRMASAAD